MDKIVKFCNQPMRVVCDEKCEKAWGINGRPSVQLSDDPDDIVWLADGELDTAPILPGVFEGGETKPQSPRDMPNKWCVRECERCSKSRPGMSKEPLFPVDFSRRIYNIPRDFEEESPVLI